MSRLISEGRVPVSMSFWKQLPSKKALSKQRVRKGGVKNENPRRRTAG